MTVTMERMPRCTRTRPAGSLRQVGGIAEASWRAVVVS